MQNVNLFGLFLATLIGPELQEVDEEIRSVLEEVYSDNYFSRLTTIRIPG